MHDLDSIILDTAGWRLQARSDREIAWQNDHGDTMGLFQFPDGLQFDVRLDDVDAIRRVAREQLREVDGCVLEIERVVFQELPALRQLFKFRVGRSLVYRGSYSLSFRDTAYVIQIDCPMIGTIGVRELIAGERLASEGAPQKWFADPYDASFEAPLLRAASDDERFDALVPDHPLSRLRSMLSRVSKTTAIDLRLYDDQAPITDRGGVASLRDRSAADQRQTVGREQRQAAAVDDDGDGLQADA